MKIVVGGMLNKTEIAALVKSIGGEKVEVDIKSDLDATLMVKNNQALIYIGACHTGGGGSLAMPLALLGADKCLTVAMAGRTMTAEEITQAVERGVIAFGMVPQAVNGCVTAIVNAALAKYGEA
jgi:hypothetical protein